MAPGRVPMVGNLASKQKDEQTKKVHKMMCCLYLNYNYNISLILFSFPSLFHAAYGYGFLMVAFVSLGSLCGAVIVPLVSTNSKLARVAYEYAYAFMIAVGASALLSDAILHLIPHVSLLSVFLIEKPRNIT